MFFCFFEHVEDFRVKTFAISFLGFLPAADQAAHLLAPGHRVGTVVPEISFPPPPGIAHHSLEFIIGPLLGNPALLFSLPETVRDVCQTFLS